MMETDRWLKTIGIMKPVVAPSKFAFLIAVPQVRLVYGGVRLETQVGLGQQWRWE